MPFNYWPIGNTNFSCVTFSFSRYNNHSHINNNTCAIVTQANICFILSIYNVTITEKTLSNHLPFMNNENDPIMPQFAVIYLDIH
jgi:hypothetical protein